MPIKPYPETHEECCDQAWQEQLNFWGFVGEDPESDFTHHCDKERAGIIPKNFTKPSKPMPSEGMQTITGIAALAAIFSIIYLTLGFL